MKNIIISLFSVLLLLFVVGCGSSTSIKKGDKFEVLETLSEVAAIQSSSGFEESFTCQIPKGSILQAEYNVNSSGFFECKIIALGEITDDIKIQEALVPNSIMNKEGYRGFTVTFSKEYTDTKLKKL